jgi:hypothetical protein
VHHLAGITYVGQKTHDNLVKGYLDRAQKLNFTEEERVQLGESLLAMRQTKLLLAVAQRGRKLHPKNPHFPWLEAEAYVIMGPHRVRAYNLMQTVKKARDLTQALPPGPQRDHLLERLQEIEDLTGLPAGMAFPFGDFDFPF